MKRTLTILACIFVFPYAIHAQDLPFNHWFDDGVMRIDILFTGSSEETSYSFAGLKREKYYSGSKIRVIDPFDYGDHKFEVKDASSGNLIYSQTYCTLFREWQTTPEADSVRRAFSHVIRFPWPRSIVKVEIHDRDSTGKFNLSWSGTFDPSTIYADPGNSLKFETVDLEINGPPEEKVDILFLAEGYSAEEMDKFITDAERSAGYIFSEEPFLSNRNAFNIRAVLSAGTESGTDIPGQGIWRNTVMNSTFYTFGIERYMTTLDFKSVCDVASNAHYDQIYILVNTDKYGGGGMYNLYSISAADNLESRAVVIHEFGHSFGGLADEYFNSAVAYNDFYPLDVEPWNPNLTTLVDFGSKWRDMLKNDIPVPTPEKQKYEKSTGVFEGGGYVSKGVFRPMIDCRMHTNDAAFCPVCSKAIEEMIRRHSAE